MTVWVDVVARTRGLATRLLTESAMTQLAHVPDLRQFAIALASLRHRAAPERTPTPAEIEDSERLHLGAQVRLLARWAGRRVTVLTPLYEQEDCRSIRAMLRGASARTDAIERLAGLIPTPTLPVRALDVLSRATHPSAVSAALLAWRHPYGAGLAAETARQQPDPFAMELVLVGEWAKRARSVSRRGGFPLRTFVRRGIDLANCWSALLVAGDRIDVPLESLFVEGGTVVPKAAFLRAAGARSRAEAVATIRELVRHSPLAGVTGPAATAELHVQHALLREQQSIARREPLGSAPIIAYWLRLREEAIRVRRILWSIAAGAPPAARALEAVGA